MCLMLIGTQPRSKCLSNSIIFLHVLHSTVAMINTYVPIFFSPDCFGSTVSLRNHPRTPIKLRCHKMTIFYGNFIHGFMYYIDLWGFVLVFLIRGQWHFKCHMSKSQVRLSSWALYRHAASHDNAIKWNHFPRYWPFVRGIHRWIPHT